MITQMVNFCKRIAMDEFKSRQKWLQIGGINNKTWLGQVAVGSKDTKAM